MVRRDDAVRRICSHRGILKYGRSEIRSKKKLKKHKQEKSDSNEHSESREDSAFTITLNDVEDFDARDLNVVPNSLENVECTPWVAVKEEITNPEKLLNSLTRESQVESDGFCPVCTAQLLGVEGDGTVNDVCTHSSINSNDDELILKAKHIIEQNVLTFLTSLTNEKALSVKSSERKTGKGRDSASSERTVADVREVRTTKQDTETTKMSTAESFLFDRKFDSKFKMPKIDELKNHIRYMAERPAGLSKTNDVSLVSCGSHKPRKSRTRRAEREITCTMSKVSMHAYMSSSKSEVTAALVSEAVQTSPTMNAPTNRRRSSVMFDIKDSSSSKENRFSEYTNIGKLKSVCGKMLLEMCNVRDQELGNKFVPRKVPSKQENPIKNGFPFYHLNPSKEECKVEPNLAVRQDYYVNRADMSILRDELPVDWLTGLHWNKQRVQLLPPLASHHTASPSDKTNNNLRPLLCTKLSIPWFVEKTSPTNVVENRPKLTSTVEIQTESRGIRRRFIGRAELSSKKLGEAVNKDEAKEKNTKSEEKKEKDNVAVPSTSKSESEPSHLMGSGVKESSMSKKVSILAPENKDLHISVEQPTMEQVEVLCNKCKTGRSMTPTGSYPKVRKLHKVRSRRGRLTRRRKLRSSSRHSRARYRPKSLLRKESLSHCDKMTNLLMRSIFASSSSDVKPKALRHLRSPRRHHSRLTSPRRPRSYARSARRSGVKVRRKRQLTHLQNVLAGQGRLLINNPVAATASKLGSGLDSTELALINEQIKALAEKHIRNEGAAPFSACYKRVAPSQNASAAYSSSRPTPPPIHRQPRRRSVRPVRPIRGAPRRIARRSIERRKMNHDSLFSCWIPKVFKL